jgi:RNA polymerase sigma factor (sigma-70 family)
LRAYPRLRDASNLRSWIFTVAHRKALDRFRARRRESIAVAAPPDGRIPPMPEPEEELWARVRELPSKQRTAIALRFVSDAGYADIASVMGTSEEAARRSVHEGLKRLRTEYHR